MLPEIIDPGSPADWMKYAMSDLELARSGKNPGVMLENLCFHAQQAVEKSLKAIIIAEKLELTKTHNIKVLFDKLNLIHKIPENLMEAAILTDYAVTSRYPGIFETVTEEEYHSAISLAQNVVDWAMDLLAKYEF